METIIGLLFILLPFIFKLIGKKLEQAGKSETADKMKKFAQYIGTDDEQQEEVFTQEEHMTVDPVVEPVIPVVEPVIPVVEPVVPVIEPVRMTVTENVQRQVPPAPKQTRKPILFEEPEKKAEKIDPKKLVVYSEIMKPKYTE